MKRFVPIILAVVMLLSCVQAMAQQQVGERNLLVDEPTTITVLAIYNTAYKVDFENEQHFWKIFERNTGVTVDWKLVADQAWGEQKSILLAGGDLPDVIFVPFSTTEVMDYGMDQGLFLSLTPYLEDKELTPYINEIFESVPELKAASTLPDGNIYGLGYYMSDVTAAETTSGLHGHWVTAYAEAAGVDVISIVTLDDFYDALVALKGVDYNGNGEDDEIPFGSYTDSNVVPAWAGALLEYVYNAYGCIWRNGAALVNTRTQEAHYAPLTEEFRLALEYLNKLYTEGLLDALDDAISVHGFYTVVEKITAPNKAVVKLKHISHAGYNPYFPGDVLTVSDGSKLSEYATVKVKSSVMRDDMYIVYLEFEDDIRAYLKPGDYLENAMRTPEVSVTNCVFDTFPAIRFGTARPVWFEGNVVRNCNALLLNDLAQYWFASGVVKHVAIRNNTFENMNTGVMTIMERPEDCGVRHNFISVTGNRFMNCNCILDASDVNVLTFQENTFDSGEVRLKRCMNVNVQDVRGAEDGYQTFDSPLFGFRTFKNVHFIGYSLKILSVLVTISLKLVTITLNL